MDQQMRYKMEPPSFLKNTDLKDLGFKIGQPLTQEEFDKVKNSNTQTITTDGTSSHSNKESLRKKLSEMKSRRTKQKNDN